MNVREHLANPGLRSSNTRCLRHLRAWVACRPGGGYRPRGRARAAGFARRRIWAHHVVRVRRNFPQCTCGGSGDSCHQISEAGEVLNEDPLAGMTTEPALYVCSSCERRYWHTPRAVRAGERGREAPVHGGFSDRAMEEGRRTSATSSWPSMTRRSRCSQRVTGSKSSRCRSMRRWSSRRSASSGSGKSRPYLILVVGTFGCPRNPFRDPSKGLFLTVLRSSREAVWGSSQKVVRGR
jgi:hypothetical protein